MPGCARKFRPPIWKKRYTSNLLPAAFCFRFSLFCSLCLCASVANFFVSRALAEVGSAARLASIASSHGWNLNPTSTRLSGASLATSAYPFTQTTWWSV